MREDEGKCGMIGEMRRFFLVLLLFSFLALLWPIRAWAVGDFTVESFESKIALNQDTLLTVEETIKVEFHQRRHGIFRIIPVVYSARGKTIKAKLELLSVTDDVGAPIPYQTSRLAQSIKIRIGDPDKTIIGDQIYVITYQIDQVVLQYPEHDEIYWNVTGSEWSATIEKASAKVDSSFAKITQVDCFLGIKGLPAGRQGIKGEKGEGCSAEFSSGQAKFAAVHPISWGQDFTIVIGLDKDNQLIFPSRIQKIFWFFQDNWGYSVAFLPLLIIFLAWYKKGRDKRYLKGTVFYKPEDQLTETVPIFTHEHLPAVYSPIDKVTPAQIGTIIDEKVDIQDVVAEMVELARLGYLEIRKMGKKEYVFVDRGKDEGDEGDRGNRGKIRDYQEFLLESIFGGEEEVKLSDLKNKFYTKLPKFKSLLYQSLADEGIFAGNPEVIRVAW